MATNRKDDIPNTGVSHITVGNWKLVKKGGKWFNEKGEQLEEVSLQDYLDKLLRKINAP